MRDKINRLHKSLCKPKKDISFTLIDQEKEDVQAQLAALNEQDSENYIQVVFIT